MSGTKKRISVILMIIATMLLMVSCGSGQSSVDQVVTKENDSNYESIEKMLQGTWDYYSEEDDFGERLIFDDGSLDYTAYMKSVPEKDNHIVGSYRITDEHVITNLNGHEEKFDYKVEDGNLSLSIHYTDLIDETRSYTKIKE